MLNEYEKCVKGDIGDTFGICKLRIIKLQGGRGRSFYLGKVEEGIEGSPLNFFGA